MRIVVVLLAFGLAFGAVWGVPGPAWAASEADGFAWRQHPGGQVPLGVVVRDDAGRAVALGRLLGEMPVILDLGYFHCPSLCGVARSDLYAALAAGGLVPGRDVSVVSVSIDPAETSRDAAAAATVDLAGLPQAARAGVHYVTAPAGGIDAVEQAAGFRARWDARFKQFMHPAGIVVLTRSGVISSYLLGVGYSGGDLRAAVLRAGDGGIAEAALPILLLCFHFDATTGRYTLEVMKVLRVMGALTVLVIAGLFVALSRKKKAVV